MKYLLTAILILMTGLGCYKIGYEKAWNVQEKSLGDAWIRFYDCEANGNYWDNK